MKIKKNEVGAWECLAPGGKAGTVRKNVKIGGRSLWQLGLRNFEIGKSW